MLIAYKSMDNIPYDAVNKIGFWRIFVEFLLHKGNVQILYMILPQLSYK